MDTSNGNLYKGDEMSDEQIAEIKATLKQLTEAEYDKYAKLPATERPVARSFDIYMKQKRRWAARTPRDAFYAGYAAALADKGLTTAPADETKGVEDGSSNTEKQS